MNNEQYRCIVGHMMYWKAGVKQAMEDCGIAEDEEEILDQLFKAGYRYNENKNILTYRGKTP